MYEDFEIAEAQDVIRIAQRRADRLRYAHAVAMRGGQLVVTAARYETNPIEICYPCKRRPRAKSDQV